MSRRRGIGLLAVVLAMLALVGWVTIPRLPAGICFDDAGDLQLSSATLGIAHPPGYPGYATVGFLLTRIFTADPAYVVSVTCFVAGLCVLVVCLLLQVYLGVSVWFGAAITLALAVHPRFWTNLRAPEVYMPTLALMVLSACFLVRYSKMGLRQHLVLAVLLFGVAMGNRPPVLFAAPFFLIAWNHARRRWSAVKCRGWSNLTWMVPLAMAPTVYSFAYIYVRDRPDVSYNYIENHNEVTHVLPASTDGPRAKLRRAAWQISGEQFRHYMGVDWRGFVGKWRWVRTQVAYEHSFTDLAVFLMLTIGIEPPAGEWYPHIDIYILSSLALFGLVIVFRRCRVTAWLLTGLIVSCLTFVLVYQVFGQAADLLPLLFAGAVAVGVLGSKLFPAGGHWVRQVAACAIALGAAVLFVRDIPNRPLNSTGVNATEYLERLDLETFPGPAVLIANWTKSVPMRYAQCVLAPRSDLHIVTSDPEFWMNLTQREQDRPVYAADALDSDGICNLEPFRIVFLLRCPKMSAEKTPSP
jgi:hypothetical protein